MKTFAPSVKECDLVVDQLEGVYGRMEQLLCEIGGENALKMLLAELPYKKNKRKNQYA